MKTLIVYSTLTGNTEKIVMKISERIQCVKLHITAIGNASLGAITDVKEALEKLYE